MPKTATKQKVKPFLKWVGGKRQLLDEFSQIFPEHDEFEVYYEPMVGGGAVFFHLQPSQAVINDTNEDLIRAYKTVRDDVERIIDLLKEYKRKHSEDFYYEIRDKFNEKKKDGRSSDVELSAMLIYMNRTGFNGLYRVNQRGEFNVPFGSYSNPTICNEDNLKAVSKILKDTEIMCADFKEGVKNTAKGDFVYFDPPYVPVSDTANFTEYNGGGFGEKDHRRLARVFADLDKKGTKVALSNSDTEFTKGLYSDFNIHILKAKRSINCNGGDRGSINELLITNF